jgi:hypothetical protein
MHVRVLESLVGCSYLLCISVVGDDLGGCDVENKHLLIDLLIRTDSILLSWSGL